MAPEAIALRQAVRAEVEKANRLFERRLVREVGANRLFERGLGREVGVDRLFERGLARAVGANRLFEPFESL